MSTRWFGALNGPQGTIIYDPCTGQTRVAPTFLSDGRQQLNASDVRNWPSVHPREADHEYPVSLCWSPIVTCNFNCPHCLDDKAVIEGGAAERVRIGSLIANSNVVGVDVSGGEPLLIRELPGLLNLIRQNGIAASFTTNGWRLAQRVEQLVERTDAIRLSLDGPTVATHDRWRREGSFSRALLGLRAAISANIPVQIQTVVMRSNVDALQDLVNLATGEGAQSLTLLQMLPIGTGAVLAASELLSDDEVRRAALNLEVPSLLDFRVRYRSEAGGFTVVRADGSVWRNNPDGLSIGQRRPLREVADLMLGSELDGSA